MRLRTVNRLTLVAVSSAIVTSLLSATGCQPAKPAQQKPGLSKPVAKPVSGQNTLVQPMPRPVAMPMTMPASMPTPPVAGTEPATMPATQASTLPATLPATNPATEPSTQPAISNAPAPTDPQVIESDSQLAERLVGVAELEFSIRVTNPNMWPLIWKHQIAMFEACNALNPKEARFPRLEADAYAQLHDVQGEKGALGAAIVAQQARDFQPDEFVWNRDLDLHLLDYQTATEKISYLRGMIGATLVPANVRAHAGYRLAQVYLDQGTDESAAAALSEALITCPSSVECLNLRYSMLPANAPRFERCTQLLDLLRANPLQSQHSAELADLIADAGLVPESLPWYDLAISTLYRQGNPATHSSLYKAAEQFIADEKPEALRVNTQLLKLDPTNTQAHFLQLVITRSLGDKDAANVALQQAGNAISNRIIEAVNAAAPKDAPNKPTTRPINDPTPVVLPDLTVTVTQLNAGGMETVKSQFAEAVADLAMLQGYFAEQPDAAAKLIDVLRSVVPDNSPVLTRLLGWNDLLNKKPDDAKAKFAAVLMQDPLAQLGMVKIAMASEDPTERQKAESEGRKLIAAHPSGLLGAILWEQLHSERVKLIVDEKATALRAPLAAFPTDLLTIADKPQSMYALHVQPVLIGSYVGEPLLATVDIDNLSGHDLTIGPDGVLKPELLFKVTPEVGAKWPSFSAFDNLAGPTVLPAHSDFKQTVRLDQTQMLAFLDNQSGAAFEIAGVLTSNEVVHRLGGYPVEFTKDFYRQASPPSQANLISFSDAVANGRPDQKITAISMMQLFIAELRTVKNPPASVGQEIAGMMEVIHHARTDSLPAVAAWAAKCEAELLPPAAFETVVRDMAEDTDWRHRQLSLLLLAGLDSKVRDSLLAQLEVDPQQSVRADATVVQSLLLLPPPPPTTMPATRPATIPTTLPDLSIPVP